ncbi:hypothetical protein KC327_g15885 [Hortaea werneckii]|uniref:Uncharacterized protein n=1 Tax=Hortaea werneckii EXF-2000 TaxID=1157616 RepID=A0A1Z5TKM0_HORWE|nr:hypothetical protein KC358_g16109 [Hortaea werneckii]OTA36509.1 hypothetical protein BTJ68_03646 [Hortaea werneckii EXF-2000]KAI6947906.1 hypothetical protein KC348_g2235 [Hortaea werneckii]KAI6979198.1 hypothetical protein KC321_g2472 [Hortaea werneckii]KAI7049535.1 hypothetical protein KC362_g1179 [Hortaea werneckii]
MPSADELISDLDQQFHEPQQPQPVSESPPVPVPSSKKGKKKAKKHAAAQARRQLDEEEDTPYAKSVTPSPPTYHQEKQPKHAVQPRSTAAQQESEPGPGPAPVAKVANRNEDLLDVPIEEHAWYEQPPAPKEPAPNQEPARESEEQPPKSQPAPSPAVRSPLSAAAKPVSPAVSPPVRPASLYGTTTGPFVARPGSSAGQHPVPRQRAPSLTPQQTSPRPRFAQPASTTPRFMDPPPPHMPQPHFFGAPDIGLNLGQQKSEQGKPAGSDGYCCRFDTFADAGDVASGRKAQDALLVGSECGLEAYRVLPDKLEVVGRLEGLRGAVIDAKVLPQPEVYETMPMQRPLVAMIVHGVMSDDRRDSGNEDEDIQEQRDVYQTTIEVYSLQTQQHIATLYRSTAVKMEQTGAGHLALPPGPVGNLTLDAAGSFVVVSSGKSGEIWVFSGAFQNGYEEPVYRCLGKFWTALQQCGEATKPAGSDDNDGRSGAERLRRQPLFSLSSRWLAVVPPYTSASISIQGFPILTDGNSQPPGLNTHVAPSQPALTCEIAGLDAEDTWRWLSRKAAQELVRATRKTYELSAQGWRELTHPTTPSAQQSHHTRTASHDAALFPPTNAPADDPKRLAKEPALLSIIDLQKLLAVETQQSSKQLSPILSTFALVEGCNYLSFSPDGLKLLASSRKGEITSIWDLAHVAHGSTQKANGFDDEAELKKGPHVTHFHRIMRSSPAVVIDSVWSRDGDWLAMLTANGTVHLHEIPLTATLKKRKRRTTVTAAPPQDKAEATLGVSQPNMSPPSSNGFLGGWRSWSQSVSTQVNAMKSQNAIPTTFAGFREAAVAAGAAGRKAVGKGLNTTYSAAKNSASDAWHAEDNKIRPKPFADATDAVTPGRLQWVQRQSGSALAVACGGNIFLYSVQRVTRMKGDTLVSGLKKDKYFKTFPLLRITTGKDGTAKEDRCRAEGPHGFWSLRYAGDPTVGPRTGRRGSASGVVNEVETNPPYCPFHIDSRVGIYAFDGNGIGSQSVLRDHANDPVLLDFKTKGHGFEDEEPWLFGEPLPFSAKVNEQTGVEYDGAAEGYGALDYDDDDDEGMAAQVESRMTLEPGDRGEQQIKVNTRRSRRSARHRTDELSVLDDDEDVDDGFV